MTAAHALPAAGDDDLVVNGLLEFATRVVLPIEADIAESLHNPRRRYSEEGREVAEVVAARRAVRVASAEAGYYAMFTPAEVGGAGLGAVLYFLCYEALHH